MPTTIQNKIQIKRGNAAPSVGVLDEGEPGYDLKNKRLYIGNGLKNNPTAIPNEAYISSEIAKAQLSGTADLSAYATKEYVNNSIKDVDVDLTGYATEKYVEEALKDISVEDVAYYDNENTVDSMIPINVDTLGGRPYSEYATENFVKDSIAEAMLEGEVDLSNYVTKEDLAKIDFPVDSVNGKTGSIELNAADVGARSDIWFPTIVDIGAAPSGYGLGNEYARSLNSTSDLNTITQNGWYQWSYNSIPQNAPIDSYLHLDTMFVMGSGAACIQEVFDISDSPKTGTRIQRVNYGNNYFSEWEYINPPMLAGVSYRTTERYMGRPVFMIAINLGSVPTAGATRDIPHGIPGVETVIDYWGTYANQQAIFNNDNIDTILVTPTIVRVKMSSAAGNGGYNLSMVFKYIKNGI